MSISRIGRFVTAIASLLFAGVGLAFWVAPEQAAHRFGLEAVRASGLASLRADLGGLFVGLALLCAAAAWTRRRPWAAAAALVLAAIVTGRLIGWIDGRPSGDDVLRLVIELSVLGALIAGARRSKAAPQVMPDPLDPLQPSR